jgi:hypothetical protein
MQHDRGESMVKDRTSSEEARERLLEAGWEWELREGLLIWRRPDGRGSWYSQEVALELLEFLEEEKRKKDDS